MENNSPTTLMQMAHLFQMELFPRMEAVVGELSAQAKLLTKTVAIVPLDRVLTRNWLGRPAGYRKAMLIAFLAKSIYNLATTRQLLERLHSDAQLRRICGWQSAVQIPSESTFSRAFAQFARQRIGEQLHQLLLQAKRPDRLVGHIARDSTAIEARERFPDPPPDKKRNKAKTKRKKHEFSRKKATVRGTEIQRQRHMTLDQMLAALPQQCAIGVKKSSKGHEQYWRGYKLHLDVADGQIPISAVLTSANVHDARVAIPLMTMTSKRVDYLYDLMDSAYDANAIVEHCRAQGRVPVVAFHPRRATRRPSEVPKVRPPKQVPEMDWAKRERYAERTMVERVNARLKDEFGGRHIRVRGGVKVMAHLMFGLIAITADQLLRQLS
jgi:transposase